LLLAIDVNAQAMGETAIVLRSADGRLWLSAQSLERWRLRRPDVSPRMHGGVAYYPLAAIRGVAFAFDVALSRLSITAPPDAFIGSMVATVDRIYPAPVLPSPGGFFNYDLFASRASGASQFAGQLEAGVFGRYGVLTS